MTQFFFSLFSLLIPCVAIDTSNLSATHYVTNPAAPHPKISHKGVNIAYTDEGKGPLTLLFVHGWGINRTYWNNQLNYFKSRYRVVAIDLPGFGQSGKNRNDWTVDAFSGDIVATINQLHLRNVVLIGHSFSQDFITGAALNSKQVIGLVGVDNFKGYGKALDTTGKKEVDKAIHQFKADFKYCARQFALQMGYGVMDYASQQRVIIDYVHTDPRPGIAVFEQQEDFDESVQAAALKKLGLKLYLINSDATPTDISGLKALGIPYELLSIHRTGHFPMIEQPKQFNQLLNKALVKIKAQYAGKAE